jgi:hypothetical protein
MFAFWPSAMLVFDDGDMLSYADWTTSMLDCVDFADRVPPDVLLPVSVYADLTRCRCSRRASGFRQTSSLLAPSGGCINNVKIGVLLACRGSSHPYVSP